MTDNPVMLQESQISGRVFGNREGDIYEVWARSPN